MRFTEKLHPFERTKKDFVERGVLAELVMILKNGASSSIDPCTLADQVEELIRSNPMPTPSTAAFMEKVVGDLRAAVHPSDLLPAASSLLGSMEDN